MPNNWNAIYLGLRSVVDPTEGNTNAENAGALVGSTFGSQGNPLSGDVTFVTTTNVGGAAGALDQNNSTANDQITFDIGAGPQTTTFDAAVQYNATLTYDNGTTYTGTFVLMQDTTGRTFLVPPLTAGAALTALEANPIRSLTLNSVVGSNFSGLSQNRPDADFVPCFAAGTRLAIPGGEVAVQDLCPGDLVLTLDHGPQPLRWHGRHRVDGRGRFAPIRIRSGALGNHRDLLVSPQHRMLITGWRAELLYGCDQVLVAACHLIDDAAIRPAPRASITYHHLMFDAHQIVLAEGSASESFYPGAATMTRIDDATRLEIAALFPGLSGYGPTARRVITAREACALRA